MTGLPGFAAAVLIAAQASAAFDVASIKESPGLETGGTMRLMPGGGITVQHLPARSLITIAYRIQQFQLIGAPEWTRTTYYDVVAKPASTVARDDIFPMVQVLLADRFRLSVHREKRAG